MKMYFIELFESKPPSERGQAVMLMRCRQSPTQDLDSDRGGDVGRPYSVLRRKLFRRTNFFTEGDQELGL